jgi:hypothetical protein
MQGKRAYSKQHKTALSNVQKTAEQITKKTSLLPAYAAQLAAKRSRHANSCHI